MKKFTVSTLLLNFLAVLTPLRSFSFQQRERSTHSHTKNHQQKQRSLLSETNRRQLLHQIILFTPIPATLATNCGGNRQPANAAFLPTATKATNTVARDKFGSELYAQQYIASKPARDRSLVFGLKDEPTYLIVNDDKTLEKFALNAECSHLGCVVPWNSFEQKFVCPCHGSQYDSMGNVLRGPAPYALVLAHVDVDEENGGKIILSPWTETDFRTNERPWWT